ncbi:MAG: CAP domain-containing protein, partial [Thermomicrobiaceae bacterium]|nr:CAP domain-containing protein [Thermomicrobiaceae bacterium]
RGGLPIFGYPISEPFEQGGRLVQYFERNRFELHPELPPEYQVLPTRLGVDLARRLGYLG